MRIGADASHLQWRRTGTSRYVDGLLRAMASQLEGDELFAYYNAFRAPGLLPAPVRERCVRLPSPRSTLWTQVGFGLRARMDRCDVILGQHVLPVVPGPAAVLVLYDCLPFRHPEAKPPPVGRYFRFWMPRSAARAARVVTISRFTAAEAERWLGVDPGRISIAPPGVDPAFATISEEERVAARSRLDSAGVAPADRLVLQVGAYERHKGGPTVVAAVAALRSRGHSVALVRCGPAGEATADALAYDLGYVDEPVLRGLYALADAVCVASNHEGFGLPVLEAMSAGAPVVASDAAALREAGGDAAVYVAPGDAAALADAIEMVLDRAGAMARRAAGREWAARFTWERSAATVLEACRAAVALEPRGAHGERDAS